MDAKQFLAEFEHIVNAPGGMSELRKLIMFLAIRGELISQEKFDRASLTQLISTIEQHKSNERRIHFRILQPISSSEEPFKIPKTWIWMRLGDLVAILDGQRKPITKKDRKPGPFPYYGASGIVDRIVGYIFDEALVLVGEDGAKWGRGEATAFKISGKTWVNNHAHVLRTKKEFLLDEYLILVLKEKDLTDFITGMTVPKLNQARLIKIPIPLPPLEEQSRIVAKVDELMALCDKLEAQQQERRKLQNALRQSTLQAVASAQSPQELKTSWMRLEANFGRFFSASEDINQFRDAIFYLTLKGKLLNKDSNKIYEENLKYDNLLLPLDWRWSTLKELSNYITSGSRNWKNYLANSGDGFIRSQDIKYDTLIFENPAYVVLPKKTEGKRTLVQKGDILITITGGNVGKCAVVMDISKNSYVSQHIALIRLNNPDLAEFVHLWMINIYGGRGFISQYIYGDKPGLNLAQVGSVPIPVPSTIDRIQIISKLNHYQKMCHCLTNYLASKQELAAVLVIAVISTLTGIAPQKQKDEPVKIPQTELIAPLRLGSAPDTKAQAPLATILAHHHGEMDAKNLWQRFGGDIDAFYAQLKTEVAHGWIQEPAIAEMREKFTDTASG